MGSLVDYELEGTIAVVTMDDGRVNVLSSPMQTEIHRALDRAEADRAVVVLAGRDGVFSAGFDLGVLRAGGAEATAMLEGGFELSRRLLAFPTPVVVACTGHAVAMGLFLLLSGDYRIGPTGPYKFVANEVALGLTLPRSAIEVLRQRLTPAAFDRAVGLAETFTPAGAVAAGIVDALVEAPDVPGEGRRVAARLATLDLDAHAASKRRAREPTLRAIEAAMLADGPDFRGVG